MEHCRAVADRAQSRVGIVSEQVSQQMSKECEKQCHRMCRWLVSVDIGIDISASIRVSAGTCFESPSHSRLCWLLRPVGPQIRARPRARARAGARGQGLAASGWWLGLVAGASD